MASFDLNSISSALNSSNKVSSGVDFTGKSLKLDAEDDAKPIVDAINACASLDHLTLTGNTLGVAAAQALQRALEHRPELRRALWSDMFTGRMKTEIPPALSALGDGMITAGARLTVLDLSDNAFGPIGVEGLARLLRSEVCSELQELRLNNNGLGITGGRLLASALTSGRPPRLRTFVAGRNRLENDGAKALADVFRAMGSLEEIAMPQNGIYHPGICALSAAFELNPGLRVLNLNDNTIGPRGAQAIADAMPKLKNLRHINFGDCLLKSSGALALAKSFKENAQPLESLDVSHNEIGRDACAQLAADVTSHPACGRLARVVLAGNSLGGAAMRQALKARLGDAAALSDGEGSDDEFVTGSEDEDEGEDDEDKENEEDSATEDAQHEGHTEEDVASQLEQSDCAAVESAVETFLQQPSMDNYSALGDAAPDLIDAHLQSIPDSASQIAAYVAATFKLSGLGRPAAGAARRMYSVLLRRAASQHAQQWTLANSMLQGLALIKSEDKTSRIAWDLPNCYTALAAAITAEEFPRSLSDTLRFFMKGKREALAALNVQLDSYPTLCL